MSRKHRQSLMAGRFKFGVPDSNLDDDDDEDLPVEAVPRGQPGSNDLYVTEMDTCSSINKPVHLTINYATKQLVVRRGFEVFFRVTFSRLLTDADEFQLEFLIGRNPSASNGSLVTVTFRGQSGRWPGHIVEMQNTTVTVSFTPSTDAIVGRYRSYVNIITTTGVIKSQKNHDYDFYMLFNAWCKSDVVYLPDEAERQEYVLNDNGVIFVGSAANIGQRVWMYGQFERGILEACIYIMDAAKMPIKERNKVLKVIRVGSAMCNAQDDSGVLVGNWGDDFSMGTAPTAWIGSVKILLQYSDHGLPVCYAQCWVFAGVFNTFLRCLGIPARVITNFSSAHDNTGNLKTDLIFHSDGSPDDASTSDSIWNFHVWNEVWMKRTDMLPKHKLDGWQVVDATPQENSDGYFRCGPASVKAIKDGDVSHPFDTGFVFAEVNSDVVYYKKDKYGNMSPFKVDTTLVGQCVCTKAVGSGDPVDITHTYKHQEGSAADKATMERAESQGVERDHSNIPEHPVKVIIHAKEVFVGSDIELDIEFYNQGDLEMVTEALMSRSVIYYTGVVCNNIQEMRFIVTIPGHNVAHVPIRVTTSDYLPSLGSQLSLRFVVSLNIDGQPVSAMKVVNLKTKDLTMALTGAAVINQDMFVTVSVTNPYNFALENIFLFMEGSGLMDSKTYFTRILPPGRSITWQEEFRPRLLGLRGIAAVVYCSTFCTYGYIMMNVT